MLSIDTNIIVYALNSDVTEHNAARSFLIDIGERQDVIISEQVLVEVYLLIRNQSVFEKPCNPSDAVEVCEAFRSNPNWKIVDCKPVMDDVWQHASEPAFPRRRIIDARLAITLRAAGVTDFATSNTKDFLNFGFNRVWNPLVC